MKRRNFIRAGALSGAGLMAPGLQAISDIDLSPSSTLNVGVIGTGSRGGGLVRVLKEFPKFRVNALCDILPFRLEKTLPHADPSAETYSDYRQLLDNIDVDAVIVSTPLSMHYEMASAALDAGKHVYCEKTMTYEKSEAIQLVEKAGNRANQIFQTGYQYRYHPLYAHVADYIRDGSLGTITNIYVQWNRNGDWRRPVPSLEYEEIINWRMYRKYSGGLTAELHSHQLEYINWIFDSHPLEVVGFGGIDYWKDGRETFDNVHTLFKYPGGLTVNCVALTANGYDDYLVEFRGSKGTIRLDYDKATFHWERPNSKERGMVDGVTGATLQRMDAGEGISIESGEVRDGWNGTHYALDDFYKNVIENTMPSANVRTGARAAITVRMAVDAMRNNRRESWKDDYNI